MAKDLYKYFRIEARELIEGIAEGIARLREGNIDAEQMVRLLRLAHTLKGAARVVKRNQIAEFAHQIEDGLAPHRDGQSRPTAAESETLTKLVRACFADLDSLDPRPEAKTPEQAPAADDSFSSVRIDITDLDGLLLGIANATVYISSLQSDIDRLDSLMSGAEAEGPAGASSSLELRESIGASRRSLRSGVEKLRQALEDAHEIASGFRLLPASMLRRILDETIRDAAESTGKQAAFELKGGDQRLDAHILFALRDALVHIVRNSVAHGIEDEDRRKAAGKPVAGTIRVSVQRKGQRVQFLIEDDGAGIDVDSIKQRAIARGLLSASEAESLSVEVASQLLLRGGISTADKVSQLSGRGVGMELVRDAVARLNGEVAIHSKAGLGTSVEILVPATMESLNAIAAIDDDLKVLIPFQSVTEVRRVGREELIATPQGLCLQANDSTIPFRSLRSVFERRAVPAKRHWTTVIVRAGDMLAAIGFDRIDGLTNVIIRPLPVHCGVIPLVAGAAMDFQGNPQLVVDPLTIIQRVLANTELESLPVEQPARAPVLVVDDSLTSRMLEQTILQAAGYEVDLAVSGEDAIQKVAQKTYSLLIVDVEMPGMSGFELLEHLQRDPQLRNIPSILVTSLASEEHRKRGEQAGARAYIAKGEFDEGRLLRTIRTLLTDGDP